MRFDLATLLPLVPAPGREDTEQELLDGDGIQTGREVEHGTGAVYEHDPHGPVLDLLPVEQELREDREDQDDRIPERERATQKRDDTPGTQECNTRDTDVDRPPASSDTSHRKRVVVPAPHEEADDQSDRQVCRECSTCQQVGLQVHDDEGQVSEDPDDVVRAPLLDAEVERRVVEEDGCGLEPVDRRAEGLNGQKADTGEDETDNTGKQEVVAKNAVLAECVRLIRDAHALRVSAIEQLSNPCRSWFLDRVTLAV